LGTCPEFDEGFEIQKPVLSLTKDSKSPISNLQSPTSNPPSAIRHQPSAVDALIAAAQRGKPEEARRLLREIVPEYQPAESAVETAALS
jgi:hypothetical protein